MISCSTRPIGSLFHLFLFTPNQDSWLYGKYYWDLVIDFLNQNYSSIGESVISETIDEKHAEERELLICADLGTVDLHEMRRMVDMVFVDERFPGLTASTKYFFFINSTNPDRDEWRVASFKHSFAVSVQPEIGYTELEELLYCEKLVWDDCPAVDYYTELCRDAERCGINIPVSNSYSFSSLSDTVVYLLFEMIHKNCNVKKCPNCNRYFVPATRSDTIYCDNPAPQMSTKTCKEYSKYEKFLKKTQEDETVKVYRQIYNSEMNKIRRSRKTGQDCSQLDTWLNEFMNTARIWKADVKAGTRTEAEYLAWLRDVKEKKVL